MIAFRLDRRSGTAVYAQLVQQVRQAIRMGRLGPGDRLPTAREVAERNGINPNTVLRAYRDLEVAGLVEPRQGSGTFVREDLPRPQEGITELRAELAEWATRARAAGLDHHDITALIAEIALATPAAPAAPAPAAPAVEVAAAPVVIEHVPTEHVPTEQRESQTHAR